jgi:hypothetical protein
MNDGSDITTHEERIRQRAYELWEEAGKPGGDHERFWHQAEAELAAEEDPDNDRAIPRRR